MSVDVLIAVAGTLVTLLVVVGMFLITPSNLERSNRAAPAEPVVTSPEPELAEPVR